MAVTADKVLVELEARVTRYNADVDRSRARFNRAMDSMHDSARRTERQVTKSALLMSTAIGRVATVAAGGLAARQLQKLTDSYTRLTNSLIAAGVASENRAAVEDRLYAAAARNGAQVEALAQLFRRGALSAEALGASQAELLRLTDGVAAALRVEGISAQQARGPLLQLGQALASPIVRAEELNSVLEGLPEVARAAARGYGTTVAEFRSAVLAGEVTNTELFSSLIQGLQQTEQAASRVSLTIGNSWTVLIDALARYIGKADDSLSATERISQGFISLADNLDKVAVALAVVGTVAASNLAASLLGQLGQQIQATRNVVRVENERVASIRNLRRSQRDQAVAARELTAAQVQEISVSRTQVSATLAEARAQHEAARAYYQLQVGILQATGTSAQLTNAKRQLAAATRNVIRLQRLERTLNVELTAAQAAHSTATQASTVRQTQYAGALARTSFMARATAASVSALNGVMAFFGGPIGVAITAVAGAVALLSYRSGEADRQATRLRAAYDILGREVDEYGEATERAAQAQERLSIIEQQRQTRTLERSLRDQTRILEELENRYARLADEAVNPQLRLDREVNTLAGAATGVYTATQKVSGSVEELNAAQRQAQQELTNVTDQLEEQRQVVLDVQEALNIASNTVEGFTSTQREALNLSRLSTRANEDLEESLKIVADTLGETSEAQRVLNELERQSAVDDIVASLDRQRDALSEVREEIERVTRSELARQAVSLSEDIPGGPDEGYTLTGEAVSQMEDLRSAASEYESRIRLLENFLQRLDSGLEIGGASDAARDAEQRMRREARAIEDRIENARAFERQFQEVRARLLRGNTDNYTEALEELSDSLDDARDRVAVLDEQLAEGAITQDSYNESISRAQQAVEQYGTQIDRLNGLHAEADRAKDVLEEVQALERLNAAKQNQLSFEVELARLRGDDSEVRRLEQEMRLRERIAELVETQGLTTNQARGVASIEASQLEAARVEGVYKDAFSRAFSEGIRSGLSGSTRDFIVSQLGSLLDEALQNLGEAIFDYVRGAFISIPADTAKASLEGAAHGQASAAMMATGIETSGAVAASEMSAAITTAGTIVAQRMAAAVSSGGLGKSGALKAGLDAFTGKIPGKRIGGRVQSGLPYIVGEQRPEVFVPDVSGTVVPRVSAASGHGKSASPPRSLVIKLEVSEGDMFASRVADISADVVGESMPITVELSREAASSDLAAYRRGKL